ncbi:MAG TPA: hypothetical protein VHQ22_04155 [Terriglobales bacterium]|jgi:hypothetical protein|nr:hypothetical protein [Terriglobales bacterium]
MKKKDVPELIAFRPNDEDKERIVRLAKQYRALKKKQPKMSVLLRRGLEKLEESGGF